MVEMGEEAIVSSQEHESEELRSPGVLSTESKSGRPSPIRRTTTATGKGWSALKSKLLPAFSVSKAAAVAEKDRHSNLSGSQLITELSLGTLALLTLRLGMDIDEHGQKRIPVLMNFMKLKITDSLYPLHDRHAVFRMELEYGDGLMKWVIYRELRDFVKLHTHYRVSGFRRGSDEIDLPTFPKTSVPLLNWLSSTNLRPLSDDHTTSTNLATSEAHNVNQEFARLQREALEEYMTKLIRAAMFSPGANRLCKFLEICALSVQLASQGGVTGKQGYLRIASSGASRKQASGLHPLIFKRSSDSKWFIVRDSCIVAVEDPSSTEAYDVFLFDSSFTIERPHRLYRQGIALLHPRSNSDAESTFDPDEATERARLGAIEPQGHKGAGDPADPSTSDTVRDFDRANQGVSNTTFYIVNSERKFRVVAKNERQLDQFVTSIERMAAHSIWAGKNRFNSFAPIRLRSSAKWLVDGRDYFFTLSSAIKKAKSTIYIHDWQLSPEIYLRRPPKDNESWRLDRLLQEKAQEGVKIFIILYKEVSNEFTPVDSSHAKQTLRSLHPNISVQRSPSHTSTGTLLWSHHEKMCAIDSAILFTGGLDLCFGRWDTPGHTLIDDNEDEIIWPGKDYANSRVDEQAGQPFEDLFDRTKTPRQPWHDIGVQILGQVARDYSRHFIQRWNFLLRNKNHTLTMPFLIPPPDFTSQQLDELGLSGTCEVQALRSSGYWSMGLIDHVEHSIQNAYIKAIQLSERFVYIENQSFISSTEVEGTEITNNIGNALVSRIIKAYVEGTPWRAIILLPLVPGYPLPLDHQDAGPVRLIMECQNRTIARGQHSIFAKLRREGIDPDDYISFFALRGWGKLKDGSLTTEAVYIHAKCMIVDDRIAIIGSANINERSQSGDRDSELASIIRDTDMIDSTMAGEPYKVGRFAHTLRVRLMREHLGVDVDRFEAQGVSSQMTSDDQDQAVSPLSSDRVSNDVDADADGVTKLESGAVDRSSADVISNQAEEKDHLPPLSSHRRSNTTSALPRNRKDKFGPYSVPAIDEIDPYGFEDPLSDEFYQDVFLANAIRNTQCYRKVFRSIPDDLVKTWQQYAVFNEWTLRHNKAPREDTDYVLDVPGMGGSGGGIIGQGMKDTNSPSSPKLNDQTLTSSPALTNSTPPAEIGTQGQGKSGSFIGRRNAESSFTNFSGGVKHDHEFGFPAEEREDMEKCLDQINGTLVIYPTRFLEVESAAGNFLFSKDTMPPLAIYD